MSRGGFDVHAAAGPYRVHKEGRRRGVSHDRFSVAEAEALRLVAANPNDTFVITQDVARVCVHDRERSRR